MSNNIIKIRKYNGATSQWEDFIISANMIQFTDEKNLEEKVEELKKEIAGGVDYLGGVTKLTAFPNANAGDFCRVTGAFSFARETAHVGDILVAVHDKPTTSESDWDLIHNEYDWTHTHDVTINGDISGTVTPAGTISPMYFSGSAGITSGPTGTVSVVTGVSAPSFTLGDTASTAPSGSVSAMLGTSTFPTLTVSGSTLLWTSGTASVGQVASSSHTHTYKKCTAINAPSTTTTNVADSTHTHNFAPNGSINTPTFTGSPSTVTGAVTSHTVTSNVPNN